MGNNRHVFRCAPVVVFRNESLIWFRDRALVYAHRYWLIAHLFLNISKLEDKTMRELTMNEVDEVTGGSVSVGLTLIGLGIAVAATAGIAGFAVAAAAAASPIATTTALTLSGVGGGFVGSGINKERC